MSSDNLRRMIATFRNLKPAASISIKPDSVQVMDPRGALVFDAKRSNPCLCAQMASPVTGLRTI
jgi:hypothetical protein